MEIFGAQKAAESHSCAPLYVQLLQSVEHAKNKENKHKK